MSTELTTQENGISINKTPDEILKFREAMENFTTRLNRAPKKEKVQTHQGYQYLPISVVEKELDKMYFGLVQYECLSYTQIFNEVACHARIKVFHPVALQWLTYDGLGSSVIQQDANTKVIDFNMHKKPNALQLALPKAYSEAVKNAAKKIGKLFGSDINRKFEDEYEPMLAKQKVTAEQKENERIAHMINDATSLVELEKLKPNVPMSLYDLYNEREIELEGYNG